MTEIMPFLLPFVDHAKEQPWFASLMVGVIAVLVVVMMLAIVSKIGLAVIGNIRDIHNAVELLRPKKKNLKDLALAEETANQELDSLAVDYGADRACIMLFHNGKTSLGNVHLLSASIKAEGGSGKFPKIANRIQSVPLLTYGHWTKEIITGHGIEVYDCDTQMHETTMDAQLILQQHSVKSLYVYPVITPSGDIDGCVFLEYCQARRELGDTEKDAIKARGQAIYSKLHEANNV